MNKLALCLMFAAGCGVDAADGVSGRFETVRYETVHVGDSIAARFTTLEGVPITTTFDDGAIPSGWDDAVGDVDRAAYAPAIERALGALSTDLEPADLDALRGAAGLLDDKRPDAWGMRTWYATCLPSSSGGESAHLSLGNGSNVTEKVMIGKIYGTRAGAVYALNYSVNLAPYQWHSPTLSVSNGANILYFRYQADPIDWIYRGTSSNRCW